MDDPSGPPAPRVFFSPIATILSALSGSGHCSAWSRVAPWSRPKRARPDVMFLARCREHRHGLRMDAANFGVRLADQKAEDIVSAVTSPSHALRTLVLAPSGPRSIFGVIDSEPGRDAECFGPTVRMTSALPARWLAALARERRPCPARKGGRGKGSPCRRSFRRREYRAASRNRPAPPPPANSARRRHGADPMGRASIRPAPLGLMAPIGAGSSTAARDRWSSASEGPISHFLTERAPLKPLSNRLTLWKRRRSFRVTTPSRRRRLSTEKCEPSRGDWSSAAMQPSRRGRRKQPISTANYAALATMDCRAETRHLWGPIASRPAQNGSTSHGGVTTTFQSLPKSCYRHSLNCDTVVIWRMSIKSGLTSR